MDGIHDLGGMVGFGAIDPEGDEPTFHAPWEATAFRINVAAIALLRAYNTDEYRHAIERMEPVHYLQARYYERVLTGATSLLVEKGVLDHADLERRAGGRFPLALPVHANADEGRSEPAAPRFAVGDGVIVRRDHKPGHTRAPRYVRGQPGVVVHVAPAFWYPDASAHGLPGRREPTYHVEFEATALWGDAAEPDAPVVVDLWESYLEPRS
ncbi:MAG: nitrile hydratase subunit beta [Myxococcota bacterium]